MGPRAKEEGPCLLCALSGPDAYALYASLGGIYDPTNGTASRGKVSRTNKGELGAADVLGCR